MTDEIDFATFGKGIFEALEKAKKKPEQDKAEEAPEPDPAPEAKKQEREVKEIDGKRYVEVKRGSAVDVIKTMDEVWHPSGKHDALSCPSCTPLLEDYWREKGYTVTQDAKTGRITIDPKKAAQK